MSHSSVNCEQVADDQNRTATSNLAYVKNLDTKALNYLI